MERNDWVDSAVPVSTRAQGALHSVGQPASVEAGSPGVVRPLKAGPIKDVLVVDPSLELLLTVQNVLRSAANVHGCSTFEDARRRLFSNPPDLLVTSVRLHAHNGLHLVYLAALNPRIRSIVHLTADDFALARDVEAAGALVVREPWLVSTIESLVLGTPAA